MVLVALLGVWWVSAPVRGQLTARFDVGRGHYRVLTFGLPPSWHPEYARLLRERYGIEVKTVAGCVVSQALISYVDSYDEVSTAAAIRKFGHDIFKESAEEARKNWEPRAAKAARQ
jgi:hypothetical protein